MMPTFTYKAMIIPETGPPNNGITYGSGQDANRLAQFFYPDMPADPLMGAVAESLRRHPEARRSKHPLYSFAGINVDEALDAQTMQEPLAPIGVLTESRGLVLLLGVDQTANTSVHYGEKLAGRKQFIRWALTPKGVRACPGWPGCSHGFRDIHPMIEPSIQRSTIGSARVQAIPLPDLIEAVRNAIAQDPTALLCRNASCERCQAVRAAVSKPH
jgi:aminoglycoside 3-N-acetyltransferase